MLPTLAVIDIQKLSRQEKENGFVRFRVRGFAVVAVHTGLCVYLHTELVKGCIKALAWSDSVLFVKINNSKTFLFLPLIDCPVLTSHLLVFQRPFSHISMSLLSYPHLLLLTVVQVKGASSPDLSQACPD